MDLFEHSAQLHDLAFKPLPELVRPKLAEELIGQIQAQKVWSEIANNRRVPNLILWGPPGSGKTTFALCLQNLDGYLFKSLNAIDTGAKDLKAVAQEGKLQQLQYGRRTIVFIDEIHRLNKAQQDVLLPSIERGELILVGATTENPSYELNAALLSRSKLVVFERLDHGKLKEILERALSISGHQAASKLILPDALDFFLAIADGDARRMLLNWEQLNISSDFEGPALSLDQLQERLSRQPLRYDKNSNAHYDLISALIKSIRASDPDAAIYYLVRMLKAGEDPLFLARRLIISASEDIGNADPRALQLAVSALQAFEAIGLPEGAIPLAQIAHYLACAPKSRKSYESLRAAESELERSGSPPPPPHLTNSSLKTHHSLNAKFPNLPPGVVGDFYVPSSSGYEKHLQEYLKWVRQSK